MRERQREETVNNWEGRRDRCYDHQQEGSQVITLWLRDLPLLTDLHRAASYRISMCLSCRCDMTGKQNPPEG